MIKDKILKFWKECGEEIPKNSFGIFLDTETKCMYLAVTTIDNDVAIIAKAEKDTVLNQFKNLFPGADFETTNCYEFINFFPGANNSVRAIIVDNQIEGCVGYYEI